MSDERYNWNNLSPAEKLVQRHKAGSNFTISWYAQFEHRLLPVAVALAKRVLYLEKEVRRLKKLARLA